MKLRINKLFSSIALQTTCLAVAGTVALAPLPVLAAPPAEGEGEKKEEAAPAPEPAGEVGGKVAMLRFGGTDDGGATEMRGQITEALGERGYEVKGIGRSVADAAKKVKCKGGELNDKCLDRVGQYLNKNAKTEFDFFVYGTINAQDGPPSSVVFWDMKTKTAAKTFTFNRSSEDYILPLSFPKAVATGIANYQKPPGPPTEEEQQILATLDEPEKTPEELKEEQKKLEEAEKRRLSAFDEQQLAAKKDVDLKKEFKDFCRNGPREDQEIENEDGSVTKIRDLRPACKRGPFWGYWQPRAYVALVLTGGLAVTTGLFYGLALGARQDWKKAKDELDAAGLDKNDPEASQCNGENDPCYAELAGPVSEAGAKVRTNAILGDVFLGATVLMAGVLGIIISQDRSAAKGYLVQQKDLADVRVGPMLGNGNYGAAASFKF